MASETVRIKPETHLKLVALAKSAGESLTETLDRAVEALRRNNILDSANLYYANLRKNKKAIAEWKAELKNWEKSLNDGLQDQ